MRAKFVPAGNRDVGSTVTRITPFHGGNDFAGTLERRVRGETWPKVTMLFFKPLFTFRWELVLLHAHRRALFTLFVRVMKSRLRQW